MCMIAQPMPDDIPKRIVFITCILVDVDAAKFRAVVVNVCSFCAEGVDSEWFSSEMLDISCEDGWVRSDVVFAAILPLLMLLSDTLSSNVQIKIDPCVCSLYTAAE